MDLVKILRSLEEFLFEAISWLLFFPRTVWRVIRRPLAMADYAEQELQAPEASRYGDSISPPLFLILAVLLAHALELQLHVLIPSGQNPLGQMVTGNQMNLLIFRAIVYSLWPLFGAVAYLYSCKTPLTRETLRPPFFALCFLTGPFALAYSSATALVYDADPLHTALGSLILALAIVWYVAVIARWFHRRLKISGLKATGLSLAAFVLGAAAAIVIGTALL